MPNPFFDDIWISIAEYLKRDDKARLARVSWSMNRIFEPLFYDTMYFTFNSIPYASKQFNRKAYALRSSAGKRLKFVKVVLPYFEIDKAEDFDSVYGGRTSALEALLLRMPNLQELEVIRYHLESSRF